ncbi:hypothetical protein ACFYPA_29410 [Streptomyces sp. NPDC005775]|uniref:hypothetical protein n=1 Tax=Streptomyces sp. NPDC005775 TaxID=3364729 RepID=UPI0036A58EC7
MHERANCATHHLLEPSESEPSRYTSDHASRTLCTENTPPGRPQYEALAKAALTWKRGDVTTPPPADLAQHALQLTGYARLLLRHTTAALHSLPPGHEAVTLGTLTCQEAIRQLNAARRRDALTHTQARARLVQALHTALDRAEQATEASPAAER